MAAAQQQTTPGTAPELVTRPFEDWRVECRVPAVNGLKCQMIQQLLHAELKKPVLAITIAHSPEEKRDVIQIVLPLGFLIKPGVDVDISSYRTRAGIDRCTARGCFIEGFAESAMIDTMKRTTKDGVVTFVTRNGRKNAINFSLRGFSRAYGYMSSQNRSHFGQSSKPAQSKNKTVRKKQPVPKPLNKRVKKKQSKPEVEDVTVTPAEPAPPEAQEEDSRNWFDRKQNDPSL